MNWFKLSKCEHGTDIAKRCQQCVDEVRAWMDEERRREIESAVDEAWERNR